MKYYHASHKRFKKGQVLDPSFWSESSKFYHADMSIPALYLTGALEPHYTLGCLNPYVYVVEPQGEVYHNPEHRELVTHDKCVVVEVLGRYPYKEWEETNLVSAVDRVDGVLTVVVWRKSIYE